MPGESGGVHIPMHQKLAVGAVAGVIGTACIFPIDTVKTRLQNQTVAADGSRMYRNPLHCAQTIIRTEGGFRALYRGLGPNLIGVTPEKAIKLAVNDVAREYLADDSGHLGVFGGALAGASAGFCQVIATNPMEIIKLNMQLQNLLPEAERKSAMTITQELGFRGVYKGAGATLLRDVPYSIVFFPSYALLKDVLASPDGTNSIGSILFSGGLAGSAAAILCTPSDVVKTRLQAASTRDHYAGVVDCFQKIGAEEGTGAFFKGWAPRALVTAPLFAIALLAFELQKNYLTYGSIFKPPHPEGT